MVVKCWYAKAPDIRCIDGYRFDDRRKEVVEQRSPVYENWKAHLREPPEKVIFEFPIYSDADGVPSIRSGLGPYEVIGTKREVPELINCPALVLRIRPHLWPDSELTGGYILDELASLLSLLSGTRLCAANNYSRRFHFYDDDPLGEPIYTHETAFVPKSILGGSLLPQLLTRGIGTSHLLRHLYICRPSRLWPSQRRLGYTGKRSGMQTRSQSFAG